MTDPDWRHKLSVICDIDQTTILTGQAAEACEEHGISPAISSVVALILEELFANSLDHGGLTPDSPPIEIDIIGHPDHLEIQWRDSGTAFDPLIEGDAHWEEEAAEDRPVGGLGLHLVRSMCRAAAYDYQQGQNCLNLIIAYDR